MTDRVPHLGLDAQGIATPARDLLEPQTAPLVEAGAPARRGPADEGRRAAGRYRQVHRSQREGQIRRSRRHDRGHDQLGRDQPADDGRALGEPEGRFPGRAEGPGRALRRRPVRRQPAGISRQRARHQPDGVAQPVRSHAAGAAEGRGARRLHARIHDHQPAQLQGRSGASRQPQRHGDRGQPDREDDPDRQHRIFGRNEEGRVRPPQFPASRRRA